MGKTRKKRDRKAFPVTESASGYTKRVNAVEDSCNDESKEELLQRIIRQLQDGETKRYPLRSSGICTESIPPASPESQECGLQSFAVLISSLDASSSPGASASSKLDLPSVLEHKLVRLVGPLMASPREVNYVVLHGPTALCNFHPFPCPIF